jgi:anti-sigma factor RsiW
MTYNENQLREMIPLYLNGTLSSEQTRSFDEALQQRPELRRELDEFVLIDDAMAGMSMPDETEFEDLYKRIDRSHAQPGKSRIPSQSASLLSTLREWIGKPQLAWGLALAQFAIMTVILITSQSEDTETRYRTLSGSAAERTHGSEARIHIVFQASATIAEVSALLQHHNLNIIAGPESAGRLLVAVDKESDTGFLLEALHKEPIVRFAEQTVKE